MKRREACQYTPLQILTTYLDCPDSAPSVPDDSHMVVDHMPKIRTCRISGLSAVFQCLCCIRPSTDDSRDLYLFCSIFFNIASSRCFVNKPLRFLQSSDLIDIIRPVHHLRTQLNACKYQLRTVRSLPQKLMHFLC